ncbi:SDR family NAD(P)-dependent oxidoreductase [Povalibacter sp.]|uniref:SDR family NAD(P)-dependent oxidoreductase n=1 Tax=Povalibacter sp. TaxID=1962978 RepID=UPI0032C21558
MTQELSGKVAIVTGGASGIGRATVELFAREGAKVVIADVDEARGEELAAQLGEAVAFRRTDVASADDVRALVDFAVSRFGGLHIMFNNAGISGAMQSRFLDDGLQDFQKVMGINAFGVMVGTQAAARHMAKHGGGSIINTASIAGIKAGFGVMTYRASKAAVIHFTKCAAIDLAEYGIRVNCIAPGHIRTAMSSYAAPGMAPETAERVQKAVSEAMDAGRPLRRQGRPDDVAQAALYLGSDRSAQVTGILIPVDGGLTAGDAVNHLEEIMEARARALSS